MAAAAAKAKPQVRPRKQIPLGHSTSSQASSATKDGRWWALRNKADQGQSLWDTTRILHSNHGPRHAKDAVAIGLYDNELPYWVGSMARADSSTRYGDGSKASPTNIVRCVIETASSMLAKNLADIKVFTNGGEWREQRKAKDLTKYIHGVLKAAGYHRHQQRAFVDGCLTRARGAVKFTAHLDQGKITCERVHPRELLWNELEGDDPRSLYQVTARSKETLKQDFPDSAAIIEKIDVKVSPVSPVYRRASGLTAYADMIEVVEGWHLPNGEANPGRHVIMCDGEVLLSEPWIHPWFPFAFFSWDDQNDGWGGRPLSDSLIPYQREVGRKLRIYRTALERAASMAGAWIEDTGENNPDQMLDGGTWSARKYRGAEPKFAAPPALNQDFFQFIQWDYEKAFAEAGISLLQSQGEKPQGIDAGVALREYNDITATRQVVKGQRLERQTVDAALIVVGLSREMFKNGKKDLFVLAPGTKFLSRIEWKDVDMEEDMFSIDCSATSSLPSHFVGRVNSVVDMFKGGIIPKKDIENGLGLRLLSMPDLEKELDLYAANKELAQMQADEALFEGRYICPEPFQDLAQLKLAANNSYLHGKTLKGVPRRNMQLLERLMSEADALERKTIPGQMGGAPANTNGSPPAAGGGAPAPGPGAAPGGAPMSPELAAMSPMGGGGGAPMPAPMGAPAMPLASPPPLPVPAVPSNVPARTEMPL